MWTDESREKLCGTVQKMMTLHFKEQLKNNDTDWRLPTDFSIKYGEMEDELVVGGVYLKHFIKQPSWSVRKPREFLSALFEAFLSYSNGGAQSETVGAALLALLTSQHLLNEQLPALGHLPKLLQLISSKPGECGRVGLQILIPISDNDSCVKLLGNNEHSVKCIMTAMESGNEAVGVGADVLHRAFTKNFPSLVTQALQCNLVPYLLSLLKSHQVNSATKAQVTKALKAMQMDVVNGEKVGALLQSNPIWASYKDQKHDLFLQDNKVAGYLTGPVGAAGYLTAGTSTSNNTSDTPPPMTTPQKEGGRRRDLL